MITIHWLDDIDLKFPDIETALEDPDGLLAAGGDLSAERLLRAYSEGIFPWYQDDQPILWWSPSVRMALLPDDLYVSSSMRKLLRRHTFRVTLDTAFADVIRQCASVREVFPGTWITAEMQAAYCHLHEKGVAHSVEVWHDEVLVGGLYGIAMGQLFFGESMFSLEANASKIALIALTRQLQRWGYQIIDCQVPSEHLRSMGARDISRHQFRDYLAQFATKPSKTGKWTLELDVLDY